MKNKATILSIFFVLLIVIIPNHAKAATMPAYLWADTGPVFVFVSVADLGILATCEWELLVIADWPGVEHIGIVMRFFNPGYQEFGMSCLADDYWIMHWIGGVWSGDGTVAYVRTADGAIAEFVLYTSPPASATALSSVFKR